jgi:Chitobiase/beta-hexosaminidase C-terminal domain
VKKTLACLVLLLMLAAPAVAAPEVDPCTLLDDPDVYPIMSTALEMHLRQACLGQSFANAPAAAVPSLPLPKGDDVMINDPAGDPSDRTTQSETSIAVRKSDGRIVAGWNDSSHYTGGVDASFCGFAHSDDGLGWTDGGPVITTQGAVRGDPDLAVDTLGNFWYSAMVSIGAFNTGLVAVKSADGDAFTSGVVAHAGTADDKVLMATDTTLGDYDGNIYLCWVDFSVFLQFNLYCTASTDGGLSFNTPVQACSNCTAGSYQAPYPAIGPDGSIYVAWVNMSVSPSGKTRIEIAKSANGGGFFVKLANPTPLFDSSSNTTATFQCGRNALTGGIRYLDFPSLAVDTDGVLHILYSQNGSGDDDADIMYVNSVDDGVTWSTPLKINDDATLRDNFMPSLAVNDNGILLAYWYDRREDANNLQYKVYMSRSLDGGATWTSNVAVSDTAATPWSGDDTADCYMGDYNKFVADDEFGYLIWSDNRRQFGGHPDPDVYFDAVPVCDNAEAAVVFDPPPGAYSADDLPLEVTLTYEGDDPACVEPGVIYYTNNGEAPDETSETYEQPLVLIEDTDLRARPVTCCNQLRDVQAAAYVFTAPSDDDDDATPDDDDDTVGPGDDDDDNDNDTAADDDDDDDDNGGCGC